MEVRVKAVPVEVTAEARTVVHSRSPQAVDAPGGLFPLHSKAFEVDEWRVMNGWPIEVPPYDIRCESLISVTGEVLADRMDPTALRTGALIRWVADNQLWDETALRWSPTQSDIGPIAWEGFAPNAPVLVDYEYRIEDERLYCYALNFDSDSANYLTASFEGYLSGITGFTIIMMMSPNSAYGNNVDVPYNGLWCPKDKSENWTEITTQGRYLWLDSESSARTRAISINPALNSAAPFYVAIVVDRPYATFYVGDGPSQPRVQTVPSGVAGAFDMDVFLGRTTEDLDHTVDMALMDIGLYADRLTAAEVVDEFSLLSQAYGGA